MSTPNPNRLIVEDTDLLGVVIGLMMHHVKWGKKEEDWPVFVEKKDGKQDVLKEMKVELKGTGVKRFGIVIDADENLEGTWDAIAAFCKSMNAVVPKKCPKDGLVVKIGDQQFGAWIMPNNELAGMVEHFCRDLVPEDAKDLWKYAEECAKEAKKRGAKFIDTYMPKAHIHTWLAWQETPGERMGAAITGKILHHESADAKAFVKWFCTLYDLKRLEAENA